MLIDQKSGSIAQHFQSWMNLAHVTLRDCRSLSQSINIHFSFNSFVVNDVYLQQKHQAAIGAADTRTPRALEVGSSVPGMSVTLFLHFFCFRARLARVAIPA